MAKHVNDVGVGRLDLQESGLGARIDEVDPLQLPKMLRLPIKSTGFLVVFGEGKVAGGHGGLGLSHGDMRAGVPGVVR